MAAVHVLHLSPEYFGDTDVERDVLEAAFDEVTVHEHRGSVDDLRADPVETDVLVTYGTPVGPALLDAVEPQVVAVYATGVDWVDVPAATERGVAVTRVPSYCDREVGEHVVALALALCRGLPQYDADTAAGGWDWTAANPLRTFSSLTFGFLAFGRKARAAADLVGPLGFERIAHDPYVDDDDLREAGVEPVSFDGLLERADVLSVHAPLTEETEDLLDRDALASLQEGAVLVNTGRGRIVDESALLWALEDGPLAGAGLDVLRAEPPRQDHPLLGRDDTVVTPHVAWNSEGAIERIRTRGTEMAIAALRGEVVDGVVNPELFDG